MNCAVKTDELKKSFHECALSVHRARAIEKARRAAERPRQSSLRLESGVGGDWLARAGAGLELERGVAPRLLKCAITRRPRAPIEDEPEREAL